MEMFSKQLSMTLDVFISQKPASANVTVLNAFVKYAADFNISEEESSITGNSNLKDWLSRTFNPLLQISTPDSSPKRGNVFKDTVHDRSFVGSVRSSERLMEKQLKEIEKAKMSDSIASGRMAQISSRQPHSQRKRTASSSTRPISKAAKVARTSEQIVSEEKFSSVSNEQNLSAEGTSAPAKKSLTDLYEELENNELAWQETRTKTRNLLFDDRVPSTTTLIRVSDDTECSVQSTLHPFTPSTALRHPRELLLHNVEGRLVCEKKQWLDTMGFPSANRAHIVLSTKDIEDIHNLIFMHGARMAGSFHSSEADSAMDKLRAGRSLAFYASKRTEIDERGWALFPGLIDDTLLPMQLLNSLLQDSRNHDMKEFLHWFEMDFEMQNIATSLEQRNASWMPICNSGDKAADDK